MLSLQDDYNELYLLEKQSFFNCQFEVQMMNC